MNKSKKSTEQAVLAVMSDHSKLTSAEIATVTKRGRSTVGKVLLKLEAAGKITRTPGQRKGARRQPDRWTMSMGRKRSGAAKGSAERLRPGQLDGLVLDYLRKHSAHRPLSPAGVAKGLGRSSGAVANCLARLAAGGQVRQAGKRSRRYATK
jgi:DNA-binding IclR family transcriptional regulator